LELRFPDKNGATKLETLTRFSKKTGKRHPDLEPPKVEAAFSYLFNIFRELDECRSETRPVSFVEIDAWQRVNDRKLSRFEVRFIKQIDRAWLNKWHELKAKNGHSTTSDKGRNGRR
jgi:hypothetical protein